MWESAQTLSCRLRRVHLKEEEEEEKHISCQEEDFNPGTTCGATSVCNISITLGVTD